MTDPVRIDIILAATAIFAVVFSDYKTCVILRIIDDIDSYRVINYHGDAVDCRE